jgi:hypothetical protein
MKLGRSSPCSCSPGELLAVPDVGLAARHVAHVRGVGHAHLDPPGAGQRVIDRPPVHPGRLHRRIGHAQLGQPARHRPQLPPERPEALDHHPALARVAAGQPDRHPDHLLVHVDPGDPRMHDVHRHHLPFLNNPIRKRRGPRSPHKIKIL